MRVTDTTANRLLVKLHGLDGRARSSDFWIPVTDKNCKILGVNVWPAEADARDETMLVLGVFRNALEEAGFEMLPRRGTRVC